MNSKNTLVYISAIAILLIGFFFLAKNQEKATSKNTDQSKSKTFTLIVKDKKLASGAETLKVNQGTDVTIKITVDEDEEFHIHGYDNSVDLTKDQEGELNFKADLTGRFPYELENSKTEIGALEVSPK